MEIAIQNERSSFPPIINYTVVFCGPELLRKKSCAEKKQAILVILVALESMGVEGFPMSRLTAKGRHDEIRTRSRQ